MSYTKTEQALLDRVYVPNENQVVTNPYSGESIELTPDAVSIYHLVKHAERYGDYKTMEKGLTMFRKYWAREYMVLLD